MTVAEDALTVVADRSPTQVTILRSFLASSRAHAHLLCGQLRANGVDVTVLSIATASWAPAAGSGAQGLVIDATGGTALPAAQYAALSGQPLLSVPRTSPLPYDEDRPALYLGRRIARTGDPDRSAMLVEDIAMRHVTIEITGPRTVSARSRDLSEAISEDSEADLVDLSLTWGSTLTFKCDRDLVRAELCTSGRSFTWWTDELLLEATEGDQVLTFDSSTHLGMTGSLVIGRLDQLPRGRP